MATWKLADAIGSGTADPIANESAVHPVPPLSVANKPAPGHRGPAGLAPRTSYTRVNTGVPPAPDAGAQSQKSLQPRGLESMPKVAHKEFPMTTTMMQRPTLQDLVKEAMEGTVHKIDISVEAERQMVNAGAIARERTKTAAAVVAHTPTDYVQKLANALDYIVKTSNEGIGVGAGPNALSVMQATSSEGNIDAGETGEAHNTIPMTPAMQSSGVAPDAATAMATNDHANFPEQPVDPMGNEKAAGIYARNLVALGLAKTASKRKLADSLLEDVAGAHALNPELSAEEAVARYKRGQQRLAGGLIGATSIPMGASLGLLAAELAGARSPGAQALAGSLGGVAGGLAGYYGGKALINGPLDRAGALYLQQQRDAAGAKTASKRKLAAYNEQVAKRLVANLKMHGGDVPEKFRQAMHADIWKGVEDQLRKAGPATARAAKDPAKKGNGKLIAGVAGALGLGAGTGVGIHKYRAHKNSNKTASLTRRNLMALGLFKQAQDLPEGVSASEEQVPGVPADVARQESMISSNAAAIDYTKREAKSDPKSDLSKVVTEPALTSATDSTLNQVFDHTQEAGAKISSDLTRTAAAQAILAKLAEAARVDIKKPKEKQSQGMPGLATPSGQSGFTSTSV